MLITEAPRRIEKSMPRMRSESAKLPFVEARIAITFVVPATPLPPRPFPSIAAISPVTKVPWPTKSVTSEDPEEVSNDRSTFPARSGWLTSTPVSSTATVREEPPFTAAIASPARTVSYAQVNLMPVEGSTRVELVGRRAERRGRARCRPRAGRPAARPRPRRPTGTRAASTPIRPNGSGCAPRSRSSAATAPMSECARTPTRSRTGACERAIRASSPEEEDADATGAPESGSGIARERAA